MRHSDACQHRFAVHGLAVELSCERPELNLPIHRALGEFTTSDFPPGFSTTVGAIRGYQEAAVLRHLSPTARPLLAGGGVMELYEEGERFWLIDDRWGLTEINLLRGAWQSWILPRHGIDPVRLVENACVWPLAQLLRGKGLSLIPAITLAVDGRGVLVLSPFGIEQELRAAVRAGVRVIGQQWSALREEDGRVSMLRMPGRVETLAPPRLRYAGDMSRGRLVAAEPSAAGAPTWLDVCAGTRGAISHHAFVDAVIVVDRGRRPMPMIRTVDRSDALPLLKQTWPILELRPQRRTGQMPVRLAQLCTVHEAQLSRDPGDFVRMLEIAIDAMSAGPPHSRVRVSVQRPKAIRIPA